MKNPNYQHFRVVQGLCGVAGTISFESVAKPGSFLSLNRNNNNFKMLQDKIILDKDLNKPRHRADASFYPRYNKYFKVRT